MEPIKEEKKEELSPRSRLMPGLAEKLSSMTTNGPFTKFERKDSSKGSQSSNTPSVKLNSKPVQQNSFPRQAGHRIQRFGDRSKAKQPAVVPKVIVPKPEEEKKIEIMPEPVPKMTPPPPAPAPEPEPEKVEKAVSKSKAKSKTSKGKKAKKADVEIDSNGNLAGRKDVVFKTLLRSVKRYYSTEFEEKTEYASLTKSKQEKL
jgi:hypothetical protein